MPERALRSLSVRGYASIRDLTLDLTSEVTLLVGANGAGKSNIVGAFELLGRIVDGQLNRYLVGVGGLSQLLYRAPRSDESAAAIELHIWGEPDGEHASGYEVVAYSAASDRAVVEEHLCNDADGRTFTEDYCEVLDPSSESSLRQQSKSNRHAQYAIDVLSGCRVFHFDDTSFDAPPKKRADVADNITLGPNAHNLAPLLRRIRDADRPRYDRIVRSIRSVAPFFDDFVFDVEQGTMLLRWREQELDRVFSADAMSDGTLRFACLATLLLQPEPPATIVLDEPELGLHPFAIHQLAGLMQIAARRSRIVAATQSVTLLSQFSADQIAVVERTSEGTIVTRPDIDVLEPWLDDYSLGEVWEKNVLGGHPKPDRLPPARAQ